jgi:hypothetical protein
MFRDWYAMSLAPPSFIGELAVPDTAKLPYPSILLNFTSATKRRQAETAPGTY